MKKIILILGILFPFSVGAIHLSAVASAKEDESPLQIVSTLPVYGSIISEIGGERVKVISLGKPSEDPHFIDAKPSFVTSLLKADLLIEGGLELESGWLPALLSQARNPNISKGTKGNLDASSGTKIIEIPQANTNRSEGDIHGSGNPHSWLDPQNIKIFATHLATKLSELDPTGKSFYEANAQKFIENLNEKINQWSSKLNSLKGKNIITYHKSLNYLALWVGLNVVNTIEPKPGIPPSSKRMKELTESIKAQNVSLIVMEDFYPSSFAKNLAAETGVKLVIIKTQINGNYIDLLENILNSLSN